MWQDHVGRALLRPTANTGVNDDSNMAVDEAEEFGLRCLLFFEFLFSNTSMVPTTNNKFAFS